MNNRNKIVIIGGGPGGYVAAIKAAQLGGQVSLIEKDRLGGTCLNRGCVPTKYLIQVTSVLKKVKHASDFGILVDRISLDFLKIMKQKQEVIERLNSGIQYLMKKNGVKVYRGNGTIDNPNQVRISDADNALIETDKIIIATGSKPTSPQISGVTSKGVIFSNEALSLSHVPDNLIIIGGGAIGIEFAQIYRHLGAAVTIVEMMPTILPKEDNEITEILLSVLREEGIDILTGAKVRSIGNTIDGKTTVKLEVSDKPSKLSAENVLIAVGRQPYTESSGIKKIGIPCDTSGKILVNEQLETALSGIYAVGDVVGNSMLSSVAMAEGICAAENAMGITKMMDYSVIPRCFYGSPEIAAVGLTEAEAKAKYSKITVGKFPLFGNSKAVIYGETSGIVKLIAESRYQQVVGASIIGPHATELISELALALRTESTLDELVWMIHPHPTISEAIGEAALNAERKGLHY